jgi:hypothetical protein
MLHTNTTQPRTRFHQLSWAVITLLMLLSVVASVQLFDRLRTQTETITRAAVIVDRLAGPAGEPALLLLNADALVATLNGGKVNLTARLRDKDGKAVPGITVNFASTQGSVAPASAQTNADGVATTIFTAGAGEGQTLVTATVDDLVREAAVQVVKPNSTTASHALQLELGAAKLDPGQQMNLSAVLRDGAGAPLAGEVISVFGSMGEVTPASAVSDANGRVSFTYHAGTNAGQAMVTALAGYAAQSATFQVGTVASPQQRLFLPLVSR